MPKTITIPADIQLEAQPKPIPATFTTFLSAWLNDTAFGVSMDTLEARVALQKAFAGKVPGDEVEVRHADWELLCRAVKTPSQPYQPAIAGQVLPFMYAITEAKNS